MFIIRMENKNLIPSGGEVVLLFVGMSGEPIIFLLILLERRLENFA